MTDSIEGKDIITLLKTSELFADFTSEELREISVYTEYRNFDAGDRLVSGSPVDGRVYIVKDGILNILRSDGKHDQSVIASFVGGECFGELDLFGGKGNPITVEAESPGGALVFPDGGHTAGEVFAGQPAAGAKVLKNLLTMVAGRIRSTNQLVSQRSPWVQELRRLVHIDKLTGLYNKTWLLEELPGVFSNRRAGSGILIIKPDKFKTINDTYGHDAGDRTLALLAETVSAISKDRGIAARHGGDVFAVVYQNANRRGIGSFTSGLLRTFRELDMEPIIGSNDVAMTVSVGIETRPPGCTVPVNDSIDSAFARMLIAREAGGDRAEWNGSG